jgi:hypothetical protein
MKNQCDECHVCCELFPVPALNKRAHVPCHFLGETGCSFHQQPRPYDCENFRCGYLLFPWPQEMRPDKCGMVLMPEAYITYHADGKIEFIIFYTDAYNIDDKRPILWTATCINHHVFKKPPKVVMSFINNVAASRGSIALRHIVDEFTVNIEMHTRFPFGIHRNLYDLFMANKYEEQIRKHVAHWKTQRP